MTEYELKSHLQNNFPRENEKCDWKEYKNLKHCITSHEGDDIVSYVSAIANMQGGQLIIGIEDATFNIVGIQDFHTCNSENVKIKIIKECTNLNSEGLSLDEHKTTDTNRIVWVFHIPRHQYHLPVYAHKKCWQRIGDSLVEITQPRLEAIIKEPKNTEDFG